MERATTAQNGTRESRKSRQMTTMAITQLLSLESSSFWSELLHDDLNIAKNNWVIDMQKMSFRQVRDIQEAVRLLSKGVFINTKFVLVRTHKFGYLGWQMFLPFRLCMRELFGMTTFITRIIIVLSELLHDDNIAKKHN